MECFWKSVRTFTYAPFISFYTFCLASVPSTLEISQFEAGSGHCWKPLMSGSGSVYKLGLRLQFLTSFVAIGYVVWGWFEFLGKAPPVSRHLTKNDVMWVLFPGWSRKAWMTCWPLWKAKGPLWARPFMGLSMIIYDPFMIYSVCVWPYPGLSRWIVVASGGFPRERCIYILYNIYKYK